ncbi:MAG TPA: protein kinase [Pseudomonadota bacterium]|nr:protein kinase [Pseudomonadota bacterium]
MIGQHIGSYKIVRVLGEGGMGEVFEAVHEKLHRRAAIKVLHPHVARAPEMAARFRNEARAVNIIHHPGVVDIYEHGQLPDGTVYLVMEYLEGRSLREVLEHDVLTESQAILLSQQLASALAAAHGKGIIHREKILRRFRQRKSGFAQSRKNFGSENQRAPCLAPKSKIVCVYACRIIYFAFQRRSRRTRVIGSRFRASAWGLPGRGAAATHDGRWRRPPG